MKKVILIFNPFSGAQKGALLARKTEVLFSKAGIKVETHQLVAKGHGEELCKVQAIDKLHFES